MPTVFRIRNIKVVVYRDSLVEPPHCHVLWPDGDIRLTLPLLEQMDPGTLPSGVRDGILANLEQVVDRWIEWNPCRPELH